MRSRFIFPPGTPTFIGPPMIDHCWTEMTHLAGFLPASMPESPPLALPESDPPASIGEPQPDGPMTAETPRRWSVRTVRLGILL
jgi:hypothetical protein